MERATELAKNSCTCREHILPYMCSTAQMHCNKPNEAIEVFRRQQ